MPTRTCIACGLKAGKSSLTRLVASPEGIRVDTTGRMKGRGAYLCLGRDCKSEPLRARRLSYALRTAVSDAEAAELTASLNSGVAPREAELER